MLYNFTLGLYSSGLSGFWIPCRRPPPPLRVLLHSTYISLFQILCILFQSLFRCLTGPRGKRGWHARVATAIPFAKSLRSFVLSFYYWIAWTIYVSIWRSLYGAEIIGVEDNRSNVSANIVKYLDFFTCSRPHLDKIWTPRSYELHIQHTANPPTKF